MIIRFEKVNKWYGKYHALRDVDLAIAKGERVVICGPSGSGKSTLIRCINGLEQHERGLIEVDGIEVGKDRKRMRGAFVGSPSLLRILRRVGLGCQRSFSQSTTTKGQRRQGILAAALFVLAYRSTTCGDHNR